MEHKGLLNEETAYLFAKEGLTRVFKAEDSARKDYLALRSEPSRRAYSVLRRALLEEAREVSGLLQAARQARRLDEGRTAYEAMTECGVSPNNLALAGAA
jgi:pentatricopeptide repeat protein